MDIHIPEKGRMFYSFKFNGSAKYKDALSIYNGDIFLNPKSFSARNLHHEFFALPRFHFLNHLSALRLMKDILAKQLLK